MVVILMANHADHIENIEHIEHIEKDTWEDLKNQKKNKYNILCLNPINRIYIPNLKGILQVFGNVPYNCLYVKL